MDTVNSINEDNNLSLGHVYVMTHSLFSDVVKIGCTPEDPQLYAQSLSTKTIGEYTVVFSLKCDNPCKLKKQLREHLNAQKYVNDFYQVPTQVVKNIIKREAFRIPTLSS